MRILAKALFVALLALAPGLGFSQALSEASVRKVIDQIDEAIARKDAAGVGKFLNGKLKIDLTLSGAGGTKTVTMDKAAYMEGLRHGFTPGNEGTHKRKNLSIKLVGQGRAVMTADVIETFKLQGQTIRSSGFSISWFELVGGKPMIVSGEATVKLGK